MQIQSNITSGKTTIQLNPSVDDNTNEEDSSENLNLSLQQEEGIDTNTVITNVIDGNGDDVPFDGYIYSSDITFEFLGVKDGVETEEVDGFECRVDEEDFKECKSGISYTVSPVPHRFEVRSYSYVGDSFDKIHDPTPAKWKWDLGGGGGFAVDTEITALDGNEDEIENDDTTTSTEIKFTLKGSADTEFIYENGFECKLVGPEGIIIFEDDCGDPDDPNDNPFTGFQDFTEDDLSIGPGTYTFTAAAFVRTCEECSRHVDPNPFSITWTID